ncbi:DASH family cryptochrome [Vibrio agarilyticus]|nr:DASH family cryptochrome [Vibrio agarilyticus]
MKQRGLYWFTHDLRLDDNPLLLECARRVQEMTCLYIHREPELEERHFFVYGSKGLARRQFEQQTLFELEQQLGQYDQVLHVLEGDSTTILVRWLQALAIDVVFVSRQVGWYEKQTIAKVKEALPSLQWVMTDTYTVFAEPELPFQLTHLPASFSRFQRAVDQLDIPLDIKPLDRLPKPISQFSYDMQFGDFSCSSPEPLTNGNDSMEVVQTESVALENVAHSKQPNWFSGGAQAGLMHLHHYFSTSAPLTYKLTRNALEGDNVSTHFSPWLANGSLSVKRVLSELLRFESERGENESTYWIGYELLWREYFQWYARKFGSALYRFRGIGERQPLTSFYPMRFKMWVEGTTPYPLVNACMNELAATGFLSNRGRQIVASCLVNELAVDWRYGASYFQSVLVDHDVASNWGNWQYIAGVGADPRGGRHFDIAKQTERYDPQQSYINKWAGDKRLVPLNSVDIVDWPLV